MGLLCLTHPAAGWGTPHPSETSQLPMWRLKNSIEATPEQSFMHCCKDLAPKQMEGKNRRWVRMYFVFCLLQKALQQLVLMGRGESCLPSLLHKAVTMKLYLLCIVFLVLCKRFLLTAEIWQAFHRPPILISGQVWLSTSRGIAQADLPIATSPPEHFKWRLSPCFVPPPCICRLPWLRLFVWDDSSLATVMARRVSNNAWAEELLNPNHLHGQTRQPGSLSLGSS